MTSIRPLGPTVLGKGEVECDLGRQHPFMVGLSHGRPQWVLRVRPSASTEGLVSLVTAFAIGPPRLDDPTGSSYLASPDTVLQLSDG